MYTPYLQLINGQQDQMADLLEGWANINSGSNNLAGLAQMRTALETAFLPLGGTMQTIPLPPRIKIDSLGQTVHVPHGDALRITKHPSASIQVFLGGHMDTVYGPQHPFQKVIRLDKNRMQGPGVADMKGGLVVLLKALTALENSPFAGKVGWEVLINPDEELGSQGSHPLLVEAAKRNRLGLLFEPSLPDGSIVTSRKGSANFTVVAKGRAAHAGRDFASGRNAISALARFINAIEELNNPSEGITINVGHVEGGGPTNIVPDLAICRFNVRVVAPEGLIMIRERLQSEVAKGNQREGITLSLHENVSRPPKPFDRKTEALFLELKKCATDLRLPFDGKPSGGVCDGNILSAEGLPVIDTLGVLGGNIHTADEYVELDSLPQRATLAAYFLMQLSFLNNLPQSH